MSARNGGPNLDRKDRGAYYTGRGPAAALSRWALRRGTEEVLDPGAGDGVFLAAAAARLIELGGDPAQVHGVEVDEAAHAAAQARAHGVGVPPGNVLRADFFARAGAPRFDAVIGNPPFIRFQRFKGPARRRALARAADAGVELSPLSSSWAPFVVHAASAVRPGGRMAMLVPHEIGQARYSRAVLSFLAAAFGRVTLVAPTERLFPGLDQDVLVLLADARGSSGGRVRFATVDRLHDLAGAEAAAAEVDLSALMAGTRLRYWELPESASGAYAAIEGHRGVRSLGTLAAVSSGYVTGANAFFHLAPDDAQRLGLGPDDLIPAVFRAAALDGPVFDRAAWDAAVAAGTAGFLFQPADPAAPGAARYLARGRSEGVDRGYKTRTRAVWHRVPRIQRPDLLLAAMAADRHALALNRARAAPANTLHAVHLHTAADDHREPRDRALALALGWLTSAAWLSRELEGRVLGGGMLKLEPGEAGRVLVPWPVGWTSAEIGAAAGEIEAATREGGPDRARERADELILGGLLGLRRDAIEALASAASALRERRRRRPAR